MASNKGHCSSVAPTLIWVNNPPYCISGKLDKINTINQWRPCKAVSKGLLQAGIRNDTSQQPQTGPGSHPSTPR